MSNPGRHHACSPSLSATVSGRDSISERSRRLLRLFSPRVMVDTVRERGVPHWASPRELRVTAAFASVAGLTLVAAGCGGSSPSHVAQLGSTKTTRAGSPSGSSASSRQNGAFGQAMAYAECMRAHGVVNWPDPMNSGGGFDKSKLSLQQLGVSGSRLQLAQMACRHLLPNGGQPPDEAQLRQQEAQALSFARCIRAHGVLNFPDPDSTGRIPDPATVGIDQGSPKFEAANQACGRYRPPYMPSNSAYNAYARTHGGGGGG